MPTDDQLYGQTIRRRLHHQRVDCSFRGEGGGSIQLPSVKVRKVRSIACAAVFALVCAGKPAGYRCTDEGRANSALLRSHPFCFTFHRLLILTTRLCTHTHQLVGQRCVLDV